MKNLLFLLLLFIAGQAGAQISKLNPGDIGQGGATSTQVLKWNGTKWAPAADVSGGSQTFKQVLAVGNNMKGKYLLQDTTVSHVVALAGGEFTFAEIAAQDTTASGTNNGAWPFRMASSTNTGATYANHVYYEGWNVNAGGSPIHIGSPGIGRGYEQRWRPGPGIDYSEMHDVWYLLNGSQVRLGSYTCDNATGLASLYHTVTAFNLRKTTGSTDYFSIQGDEAAGGGQITMLGAGNNVSLGYDALATNASFNITNTKISGTPQISFSGFKAWNMNSGTANNVFSWGTPQFVFSDGSFMQFVAGQHRWVTNGNVPINLRANNYNNFSVWGNATIYGVNVGANAFGTETTSMLNVTGATTTSAAFAFTAHNTSLSSFLLGVRNDGKIGMGTGTPSAWLDTEHAAAPVTDKMLTLENTSGEKTIFVSNATPEAAITGNPGDKAFTSISNTGGSYTKITGTGTAGWSKDLTSSNFKVLFDWTDDQANVSTTETDIFSYSVAATELLDNGTKIVFRSFGTFNTVSGTNRVKVSFGGQNVFDAGVLTVATAGSWSAETTIMRTASTTAKAVTVFTSTGSGLNTSVVTTDLTGVSYAGANIVKVTGTGSASSTMTGKFGAIVKVGAYTSF